MKLVPQMFAEARAQSRARAVVKNFLLLALQCPCPVLLYTALTTEISPIIIMLLC